MSDRTKGTLVLHGVLLFSAFVGQLLLLKVIGRVEQRIERLEQHTGISTVGSAE